jgi:hypothetical protein
MPTIQDPPKKTRSIRTFEAEPEVEQLLTLATDAGLTLKEVVNTALREVGPSLIARLLKEREQAARETSRTLAKALQEMKARLKGGEQEAGK